MRALLALANLLVAALLIAGGFMLKDMAEWNLTFFWGFVAGWVLATVMWQGAHKSRYGFWFDDPTIAPETPDLDAKPGNTPPRIDGI